MAIVIRVPAGVATALAIIGLVLFVLMIGAVILGSPTGRRRLSHVLALVGSYVVLASVIGSAGWRRCSTRATWRWGGRCRSIPEWRSRCA